jgi:hypothetical protein
MPFDTLQALQAYGLGQQYAQRGADQARATEARERCPGTYWADQRALEPSRPQRPGSSATTRRTFGLRTLVRAVNSPMQPGAQAPATLGGPSAVTKLAQLGMAGAAPSRPGVSDAEAGRGTLNGNAWRGWTRPER